MDQTKKVEGLTIYLKILLLDDLIITSWINKFVKKTYFFFFILVMQIVQINKIFQAMELIINK